MNEECKVCFESKPLITVSPCGHGHSCANCAKRAGRRCAWCRTPVEEAPGAFPPLSKSEAASAAEAADAQLSHETPVLGSLALPVAIVFSPCFGHLPETPLDTLLERWLEAPADFSQEGVETLAAHIDGSPTIALPPLMSEEDMATMEPQALVELLTAEALSMHSGRHRLVLMWQLITAARDLCRLRYCWEALPSTRTQVLSNMRYTPPRFSAIIRSALRKASLFCKSWEQHTHPWVARAFGQLRSRGRSCSADAWRALAEALGDFPEEGDHPGRDIHRLWAVTQQRLFVARLAANFTSN